MTYSINEVLCFSLTPKSRSTVRRCYKAWRKNSDIPSRCDNSNCNFFDNDLTWNGKPLPLILDHVDGNRNNNSAENLRFLCPNCDAQLPTRGGKNIGRIQNESEGGYQIAHKSGQRDQKVFINSPAMTLSPRNADIEGEPESGDV